MILNAQLSALFSTMADIMDIKGENSFKVLAFRKVSRVLKDLSADVGKLVAEGKLGEVEGIGKSSQRIIEQWISEGRSDDYNEIASGVPAGLLPLLQVEGLGPKTIALLWKERGITDEASLLSAINEGKLAGLKGIGEKKLAGIKQGLELKARSAGRMGLAGALPIAEEFVEQVRKLPGVVRAEVAGSLRRRRETVGDLDIVCGVKDESLGEQITAAFVKFPGVERILGQGPAKASVMTAIGLQVDIRVIADRHFGAALLYFTGSKEHNVKIRTMAQEKGLTLNEWGLYKIEEYERAEKKTGEAPAAKPIAAETEEQIYHKLGMVYVEPELREDRGEVEAALNRSCMHDVPAPEICAPTAFKELRTKYLDSVLTHFKCVSTESPRGNKLPEAELRAIEVLLALAHPDAAPRTHSRASSLPRFNRWDPNYSMFGTTPEAAKSAATSRIQSNAHLREIYTRCLDALSNNDSRPWHRSGSRRNADVPHEQGVYFFRNAETGRVNEGYIGVAGLGTQNTLANRLAMHFSGDNTSDNLLQRYREEERFHRPVTPSSSGLPILIRRTDIRGDLHSHTTASDGHNTIEEMAAAAKALGYEFLAITDHSRSQAVARGLEPARLLKHIEAIHAANDKLKGITLLAGSEVDILADGELDYEDAILKELDIVVASPHFALKQDPAKATDRLRRAIEHKYVNIIGHPTGRLINGREGLPLDFGVLFELAAKTGTAMEINAGWPRLDLNEHHARAAMQAGVMLSINTDSHSTGEFDGIDFGIGVARRAWLEKNHVINCMKLGELKKFLAKKR